MVDEPTELPEGTEVELLLLDPGDALDVEDREALHQALAAAQEDVDAGRLFDAEEILRETLEVMAAAPLRPRMTWEELKAITREP
ncbi:MAG TPA: hypothetical protein VN851_19565 [Thermoanaerobaculia bacterium]|nr:hypothetical protein [Thermoanaerobaculia bacterium]